METDIEQESTTLSRRKVVKCRVGTLAGRGEDYCLKTFRGTKSACRHSNLRHSKMAVASHLMGQLPRVMVLLQVHVIGSLRRRRTMLPTVIEQVRTEEVAEVPIVIEQVRTEEGAEVEVPTVIEQVSTEEESEAEVPAVIDKVVQERQVVRVQESQVVL